VGFADRQARTRRRHDRGTRGARVRLPRSVRGDEPSGSFAPSRPLDGNVAAPRGSAANQRPFARTDPRHGSLDPHADPYRHTMRPLPRRDALESEGDRCGPQVLRPCRADELLFGLPRPQLPFRRVWGDVPRAICPCYRGRRRTDRDHARGNASHSLTTNGRFLRELRFDQTTCSDPLRQMARDHSTGSAGRPTSIATPRR